MPEEARSGYSGPKVKADCEVTFTPSKSTLSVDIDSDTGDVDILRAAVEDTADLLGAEQGRLSIVDRGASAYVVRARTEAALRKALGPDLQPPRFMPPAASASRKSRPRRSRLYMPGNMPRFFAKASEAGADGIILDLEDSVSPSRKTEARILVSHALREIDFGGSEIMVRINQGDLGLADLEWVVPTPVQHILIPKVESPDQVERARNKCLEVAGRWGRKARIWLMPIIESPLGVFNALDIATAVDETCALTLGLQDLTSELGVRPTTEGWESFTARSMVVLAARAAGLQPIDTVYADVKNADGLKESVNRARQLGFVGKGCIHPAQVPLVNEAFLPTEAEIQKARKIVLAMEEAERKGLGAISVGTKMVDPPVAMQSLNTIENAIELGMLDEDWREEPAE